MNIYTNIIKLLSSYKHQEITHWKSQSCNDSKQFRKEAWLEWIWSKNILFHCKWNFYIVITIWDKEIKARNFKKEFWSKDIRFATQEEITQIIWAQIGSIPPFWFDNEFLPMYIDNEIFLHEHYIFNPWDPNKSIQIFTKDLKNIYNKMNNPIKYFVHSESALFAVHDKPVF